MGMVMCRATLRLEARNRRKWCKEDEEGKESGKEAKRTGRKDEVMRQKEILGG